MGGFLPEFLATSSRPEFWTPLAARDFLDGVVAEFLCIVYFLILFFSFFFVHFFVSQIVDVGLSHGRFEQEIDVYMYMC